MQYNSGLPDWFTAAFANAGDKNTIPATTTVTGAAALNTGWPSICSLPEEAGGIAPTREDLNGILYWLSLAMQRIQAGGFMPYNAAFATAIGGYPKGAFVRKADGTGYWMSEADSNTTDPDGESAANWADAGIAAGNAVLLTGDQIVAGTKTFSSSPVVPDATAANQAAAYGQLFGVGMSLTYSSITYNTTYTNTTKSHQVIMLSVYFTGTSQVNFWYDGADKGAVISIGATEDNFHKTYTTVIGPGHSYKFTSSSAGSSSILSFSKYGY